MYKSISRMTLTLTLTLIDKSPSGMREIRRLTLTLKKKTVRIIKSPTSPESAPTKTRPIQTIGDSWVIAEYFLASETAEK